MRVRKLDKDGDFTFGIGKANYIDTEDAITQNVVTRIKSFKDDWFLDVEACIDWFNLLGSRNTKDELMRQIEAAVIGTYGVMKLTSLDLVLDESRNATITLSYTTIYDYEKEITQEIVL